MPIIKSAKKRVRIAEKATVRNAKTKRALRTAVKAFQTAVTGGKKVSESARAVQSELDKSGKKNLMHKNKVARKQRQLAKAAKLAATEKPAAKKTIKKSAAPKAATKKTVAKKTVAKKSAKK